MVTIKKRTQKGNKAKGMQNEYRSFYKLKIKLRIKEILCYSLDPLYLSKSILFLLHSHHFKDQKAFSGEHCDKSTNKKKRLIRSENV